MPGQAAAQLHPGLVQSDGNSASAEVIAMSVRDMGQGRVDPHGGPIQ
jgi:hypothetical protein